MSKNEENIELLAMREQLQQLEQERYRQQAPSASASAATAAANPNSATVEETLVDQGWTDDLKELEDLNPEQVLGRIKDSAGEWLGELNNELMDIKPSTLLLVFGLGVAMGRLTK